MADPREIEGRFWKALKSEMTAMLGLVGGQDGHAQPMTAQLGDREGRGPIWFFTAKDNDLVRAMGECARATLQFVAKGHDLFASVQGELVPDDDPATIDRLWNRFVAAWYEGGRDDPRLQLIRFDPESAQFWLNGNSLVAGIKLLIGVDPKEDYQDKVAQVEM
jgi:general stress protein 26